MNETLMRIVIQNLCFLELSSDEILNPDSAVREMESISSELDELTDTQKQEFIDYIHAYAESESNTGQSRERVEFIRGIPESIGLVDDLDED